MNLHPGTLLLGWAGFILFLQSFSLAGVSFAAAFILVLAAAVAPARTLALIRRVRWLLLSIVVLFVFGTPGERLAAPIGDLGATRDGLVLGVEHVMRLILLLAALALVHQQLGTTGLMAGLYWLLTPLAEPIGLRERIVVRLMLVIDYAEAPERRDWRSWLSESDSSGPDALPLAFRPVQTLDWMVLVVLAGIAAAVWWTR